MAIETLLIEEVKRRLFEEGIPRIQKCLHELSEEEVWQRPNEQSNSVGNLILHLCGNVRQWIIAGLGHTTDVRQRQTEFDERGPISKAILLEKLAILETDVRATLINISAEDLVKYHKVQAFEETGVSILVHVTEHFSYHVGQITYFVKAIKNMDLGYYADMDLEQKLGNTLKT